MPAVRTVRVHDPKNPHNIMQVEDPEIKLVLPKGHDERPTFNPDIHVKVRERGDKYTPEEEALLMRYEIECQERRAKLGLGSRDENPADAEIRRLRAELAKAKEETEAANKRAEILTGGQRASDTPSTSTAPSTSTPKRAAAAKETKPAASTEADETALSGLLGAPEGKPTK